jgi:hypothetical protein
LLVRPSSAEQARVEPSRNEANIIQANVTDVKLQQDRFKITLANGLYFHLHQAPKLGEKIEVRVKVECLA